MKREGEIRNLRKVPHVKAAVDYLKTIGAADISVTQKGHVHVCWTLGGIEMGITLSSTPAVPERCAQIARQLIRYVCRKHGVEMRVA